jgi:hypothetical protein
MTTHGLLEIYLSDDAQNIDDSDRGKGYNGYDGKCMTEFYHDDARSLIVVCDVSGGYIVE